MRNPWRMFGYYVDKYAGVVYALENYYADRLKEIPELQRCVDTIKQAEARIREIVSQQEDDEETGKDLIK